MKTSYATYEEAKQECINRVNEDKISRCIWQNRWNRWSIGHIYSYRESLPGFEIIRLNRTIP